eukprot:TRINITY_DN2208_c0_g1_i4.p1 TRINITY_DN2208_c0_g1~~TRINITY_DN2208_c0_g1_i4.p1  ORF type:complete len:304 (-),score=1.32 TRINITY_DN2208_c0_g1_i4:383-1294(-)
MSSITQIHKVINHQTLQLKTHLLKTLLCDFLKLSIGMVAICVLVVEKSYNQEKNFATGSQTAQKCLNTRVGFDVEWAPVQKKRYTFFKAGYFRNSTEFYRTSAHPIFKIIFVSQKRQWVVIMNENNFQPPISLQRMLSGKQIDKVVNPETLQQISHHLKMLLYNNYIYSPTSKVNHGVQEQFYKIWQYGGFHSRKCSQVLVWRIFFPQKRALAFVWHKKDSSARVGSYTEKYGVILLTQRFGINYDEIEFVIGIFRKDNWSKKKLLCYGLFVVKKLLYTYVAFLSLSIWGVEMILGLLAITIY